MKKKIVFVALLGVLGMTTSCKKGECTCNILGTDVTTQYEADNSSDYKDLKNSCENAGCKWTAKL
ncbi:MAG: hypothetical protein KDC84_00730 [Crocinitomicaceae bacterium]|nr:hypothetical protein [Crocinitomicaceae bacterium]